MIFTNIAKSPKLIFVNSKQSYEKACVNSRFKITQRVFLKIENNTQKCVFFYLPFYVSTTLKSLVCIRIKTLFKRSLVFSKSKLPKNVLFELTLQKKSWLKTYHLGTRKSVIPKMLLWSYRASMT